MADLNVFVMNGRIATDPETRDVGEQKVMEFRLACDTSRKKDDDSTLWITGIVWNAGGKAPYLTKGRKVSCTGNLRSREWQAQDGSRRSVIEYVIRDIDPFFATPKGESKPVGSSGGDGDEIPFGPSYI